MLGLYLKRVPSVRLLLMKHTSSFFQSLNFVKKMTSHSGKGVLEATTSVSKSLSTGYKIPKTTSTMMTSIKSGTSFDDFLINLDGKKMKTEKVCLKSFKTWNIGYYNATFCRKVTLGYLGTTKCSVGTRPNYGQPNIYKPFFFNKRSVHILNNVKFEST